MEEGNIGPFQAHRTRTGGTGCSRCVAGFDQRNFMGMNASDYGGGTPVVDVWRRDYGLAVGHVETVPKLLALPVTVTADGRASRGRMRSDASACTG